MMKKNILLFVGIAGMLLGAPLADAQAKEGAHAGIERAAGHSRSHHQRHSHKKSHRHVVVSKRHHDIKSRHHEARHDQGVRN
jgi:hypothetical protein